MPKVNVGLIVMCEDSEQIIKAGEVLNRAAAGLALEGISVIMNYNTEVEDDDAERREGPSGD